MRRSARAAGRGAPAGLDIWDEQLAERGAELTAGRLRLAGTLRPLLASRYGDVSADQREVSMSYRQGSERSAVFDPEPDQAPPARAMHQSPARPRPAELDRAVCLRRPHRGAIELPIGDLSARGH